MQLLSVLKYSMVRGGSMMKSNIIKSIENVRKVCGLLENFEIIAPIGNYGDIVKRKQRVFKINDKGNIEETNIELYNIYRHNGSYVTDRWFDLYYTDEEANCIIGYKKSAEEYERSKQIKEYLIRPNELKDKYKYLYGAVNNKGILSVQPIYDLLLWNKENTLTAYHNNFSGLVSLEDGCQLTPIVFISTGMVSEGLSCVCYKKLYGYANIHNIIKDPDNKLQYGIPPQYEWGSDFSKGYAKVRRNGEIIEVNRYNLEKNYPVYVKVKHPVYVKRRPQDFQNKH